MRICVILGTRPEIVKFSPIIRELEHERLDDPIARAEIVEKTETMLRTKKHWKQPFGDGKAAKRIAKIITEKA